ncbi:MAG: valine--tRNA ligase [Lachnospiraceae bacterium]|jgi:valyl-tRNA synthetase|nr:valine--tRNA ligase [Lachnospiraceae bacterium]
MCENCNHKLNDKYNPKEFEEKIYKNWEEEGFFKPSGDKTKESFSISMPPPNITGKLHMGHALDNTIQDILIRYKRMCGYNTLWVPGTDHASIATEAKIVETLKKQGIKKDDLGRDEFLKKAWEWKKEYGGTITHQLRKLGASCDWTKERFTMDEGLSKAVKYVFVDLYKKDLIYKGKRMINWCPTCNTSISDAEVEYEEEPTHLWHIKYKITGTEDYLTVATTRPETMLGDTAIAVNPKDERYKGIIGKTCILPIMNKEIPIIADEFVEMDFGTGCVKITPAHDMNDYQAGLKHNLEIIEVFDENFKMADLVPEYKGMDIYEAREKIVEKLEELGNLEKTEDYTHNVGKCYRCHNTVEPKISEQWFVKMKPLAEPAIKAVKTGETNFIPERFDKTYFNWMENIQDWCISRQLWWGHRIPAYYCKDCGKTIVSFEEPKECDKCASKNIYQDEDTLDTWFSSALWPFSTLGWPEKTDDLNTFYPNNVLVTGYDIIFFWVARMIFSGIEYMKEVPFKDVLIHGIIRDSQGRKMSKSLGNGIDPLEIIEKYGADALRFSLLLGTTPGNDIRYMPEKLDSAGNFANKVWNAAKFVLMNLEDYDVNSQVGELLYEDKWILSKLNTLCKEVALNIEKYEIGIALDKIYSFIWDEFCDWYIEIVKPRLYDKENSSRKTAQYVLNKVLCDSLKLLHPFMPFVTEEIYTNLYNSDKTIMLAKYPEYEETLNFKVEEENIEQIKEVITGIRNIRTQMNIHPSKKSKLIFITKKYKNVIDASELFIKKLGFADNIEIKEDNKGIEPNAINIVTSELEVFIPFEDLVDINEEIERLEKEKSKILIEKEKTDKMLSNEGFIQKAPEAKIKEEKEKLAKFNEMIATIEDRIRTIKM